MKHAKTFVKFLLVFSIIFFMLHFNVIEFPSVDILLNKFSLLIILIFFIAITVHNFGWWLLLKAQQYNITYLKSLLIYMAGTFFNIIMPGGIGGDAARCMYLYTHVKSDEKTAALFSVIISRIIGFHALLSLCLFIGFFYYEKIINNDSLFIVYFLIFIIFCLSLFLLTIYMVFHENILIFFLNIKKNKNNFFTKFVCLLLESLNSYRKKINYVLYSWFISVLSHTIFLSSFYFMSIQLNMNFIGFFENTVVGGLSYISNSIPITPGGIGIGESSYNYFYKLFINDKNYTSLVFGSIFFLSYRVLYSFVCILCGLSFILIGKPKDKFTNKGYNDF